MNKIKPKELKWDSTIVYWHSELLHVLTCVWVQNVKDLLHNCPGNLSYAHTLFSVRGLKSAKI